MNRRISVYLVPKQDYYTFLFFSEDCSSTSTVRLDSHPSTDPVSTEWLLGKLKDTDPAQLVKFTKEPVGMILEVITQLLRCEDTFHALN